MKQKAVINKDNRHMKPCHVAQKAMHSQMGENQMKTFEFQVQMDGRIHMMHISARDPILAKQQLEAQYPHAQIAFMKEVT